MRRSSILSLLFILALAGGGMFYVQAKHYRPQLGLDLQGGAYVVLQPKRDVSAGILEQSVEIIRNRVDALGVAEPDISTQGDSIVVQLPGVKDQQRALDIVGQTAELRFRPVLGLLPPEDAVPEPTTTTSTPSAETTAVPTETTVPPPTTTTTVPGTSSREEDTPEAIVVLPEFDDENPREVKLRYQLGPAGATGRIIDDARAVPPAGLGGEWQVTVDLTDDGRTLFNQLAAACNAGDPSCPTRQLGIALDGVVVSAPVVNEASFPSGVEITGSFTEKQARDLALVLRYGSLPTELVPLSTQTVSATLGKDSLRAGITAGLLGLGLVLIYMVLYYRALGIVVVLGLGVSGTLLWAFVSLLGGTVGLALTLAGAVGIIVSVGVTVDSYVVYFERLKDEVRAGKTIRSSVDRGFRRAYRTIFAADASSLLGAAVLYLLTVGSVRGFAFFLGISAILDLVTSWFFTRPVVALLGRSRFFTEARFVGVARGLAATRPAT